MSEPEKPLEDACKLIEKASELLHAAMGLISDEDEVPETLMQEYLLKQENRLFRARMGDEGSIAFLRARLHRTAITMPVDLLLSLQQEMIDYRRAELKKAVSRH